MLVPASVIRRPRPRIAVLAAAVVAAAALLGSVTAPTANAMSPAQTNVSGVVNVLYWDLDSFWRRALSNNANYRSPTIGYYDGSPTYVAACGGSLFDYNIMAECPNNGQPQIWIHCRRQPGQGDAARRLRRRVLPRPRVGPPHRQRARAHASASVRGRELYADCMAGIFTKYAYTYSHRLDANDYWEGVRSLDDRFPTRAGRTGIRRRPIARPGTSTATPRTTSARVRRPCSSSRRRQPRACQEPCRPAGLRHVRPTPSLGHKHAARRRACTAHPSTSYSRTASARRASAPLRRHPPAGPRPARRERSRA